MNTTFSIASFDVYTSDGQFDSTLYEVRIIEDGEYSQDIQLESPAELIALRDAVSNFIDRNNITPTESNPTQP